MSFPFFNLSQNTIWLEVWAAITVRYILRGIFFCEEWTTEQKSKAEFIDTIEKLEAIPRSGAALRRNLWERVCAKY